MYGPPPDCKGDLFRAKYSLRKCIRPLVGEFVLRATMMMRACGPDKSLGHLDHFSPQVFQHAV